MVPAPPAPSPARDGGTARVIQLALAVVIGIAFVGFFVGLAGNRGDRPELDLADADADGVTTPDGPVVPSMTYAEIASRRRGPNRDLHTSVDALHPVSIDLTDPVEPQPWLKPAALEARSRRRAYNGAPPTVPHPIDEQSSASCLSCHGEPVDLGIGATPVICHERMASCTQCHVVNIGEAAPVENDFVGLAAPLEGSRAWTGAPPVIPHSTLMRSNCMACHGPAAPAGMRSSHPWRQNCVQCHATSSQLEQLDLGPAGAFLSRPAPEGSGP